MLLVILLMASAASVRLHAQDRVLGKADILLYGFGLRVEPAHQVVPKDIATIVSTFLASGTPPQGSVPPFAPDAVVKGVLFGPAYPTGLEITTKPNTPFNIPPIGVAGTYSFENIRLESGGEILMRGIPESVSIEVIDKLLVTQVTARALTAQEVRDKGIVFDQSNFQAYNFTAAFAVQDTPIHISFPVVLPALQGAQNASASTVNLADIPGATLPQLQTIIPDTLKLQTQIPNLQVVGFTLQIPSLQGKQLIVPPIPGVVVIPGDIGFLDQFFSVMLLVGNVAPAGSNLVVSNLTGEILLPAGNDGVVNSADDPLAMANTTGGEAPRIKAVVQPGPDGKLGTADDIPTLGPGDSGSAEYLVEGRREGSWDVEFNITGTLTGLPVGPVTVTGRAAGAVVVRNPNFTLTFTHPDTVSAGEPYSLDVTVTNTSSSPANFVSVNLFGQNISGASLVGDSVKTVDSIAPGDSATVSFNLIARVTGKVTAATLDTDDKVQGRFALKTAVGELGVAVSPDSLVLPAEADGLPTDLRNAVLGLLGKAWAVATAPNAAFPQDLQRFSKQIVYDRAVQAAEAGFRITLHEPIPDSAAQLEMDFIGSDYSRLPTLHPDPADLLFTQTDFNGFDLLRRRSVRGDVLANAVGALLAPQLAASGASAFHQSFAEKTAYRPPELSVVVSSNGSPLPYDVVLMDAQGRRVGGTDSTGKVIKEIPYSDELPLTDSSGTTTGEMLILAAPDAGQYHLQFAPRSGVSPVPLTVSIVVPDGVGGLRHVVYDGITGGSSPTSPFASTDVYSVVLDLPLGAGAGTALAPTLDQAIVPPLLHVLGVIQQADKDLDENPDDVGDPVPHQLGRIIAVLFDQEVTPESAQDKLPKNAITNFGVDSNQVVGVALQPGHRIAFLALRDPVGPFVSRQLTVTGVTDGLGRVMTASTTPIETTVTREAAVVSGQVIDADGTPVPYASVRFLVTTKGGFLGVSSKTAGSDGRFSWDWVPYSAVDRIVADNPINGDERTVDFTIQRNGQRLNVNVVFLGRGTVNGRTITETGAVLPNTDVVITSLTDQSQYGTRSDAQGQFVVARVPVGSILIDAVNVATSRKGTVTDFIPVAGGTITRDVRMFDVTAPTIVVKLGTLTGHVLRGDGATPVTDVPVVAYYQAGTQVGVNCPDPTAIECAVAAVRTDATGRFEMDNITAGQLRLTSFEQSSFQQGDARITLAANGTADVNILFSQGLGTVNGLVVDADGHPVSGARVGGGLSLSTTDQTGHFTLTDVPIGHREIVAVSDQLATKGSAVVDILTPGQSVNITVVLIGTASIAGTVYRADGTTPVPNNKVYLFYVIGGNISVVGNALTDAAGHYQIANIPLKDPSGGNITYQLSSFRPDFSDGNVKPVVLQFNNEVFRGDIIFRGGGGHVTGHVLDSDGVTPLRASVGISGDQVVVAGGMVGTGFQRVSYYQVVDTDLSTGSYSFSKVFVGPFTLSAVGQFSPDPINFDSAIPSSDATVQIDLRLQATSQIQGTVFQPDGVTPVGANVVVQFASSGVRLVCATGSALTVGSTTVQPGECADIPQGIQNESAVTDASGRFLVPLVNAGSFTLTAQDPASGKTGQVLGTIRPGQTGDFPIRLLGTSALTIHVLGSNATTPIPGANVVVKQVGFPAKSVTTIADAQGTVVLDGGDSFTEGTVVVTAADPQTGFTGSAQGTIGAAGQPVTINTYLFDAVGTVSGTVFKSDGLTPVPNAEVVITKCTPDSTGACVPAGALAFDVTDANGAYQQNNIPLGPFRVDVFEAATARLGFASGSVDFAGQQVPIDIVEAGRGLVTGTALSSGTLAPLVNWAVSLVQFMPGGRAIELRSASDIDGTFDFPGVTVGGFRLSVYKFQDPLQPDLPWGGADVQSQLTTEGQHVDVPVIVAVNQTVYGSVIGTVFNADGTPASNASVALCPRCDAETSDPSVELFAVTGSDGTFAFDHVPTGRFTTFAKDPTTGNSTRAAGELLFSGDLARLTMTLVGLGRISGTVQFANGQPVATAQLILRGQPSSGCPVGTCTAFTDANGQFTFIDVPAQTFWIAATDVVSGLSGAVSGSLNPATPVSVRIVLQPTAAVSGRVLSERGTVAPGITVQLSGTIGADPLNLFQVSDANGQFVFSTVPIGTFTLSLQDPLGPGIAQRIVQVIGPLALGDIALDETQPAITSSTPPASASGVPLNATVQVVFSKRVTAGTVNQGNFVLAGPAGPVLGTLTLTGGDTTIVFAPLSPLLEKTRYVLSIQNITDLAGKSMVPYTASLTTVDLTPPSIVDLSPIQDGRGIALATTIRVQYSEPIAPAQFRGPPISLLLGAAAVDGRTDFILGNTTIVFTPTLPLTANTVYSVQIGAATDLSGNTQPQPVSYQFRTFDQTPPQITALTASGSGTVIENTVTRITATPDASHDISVVDFYVNDQPVFAARTAPYVLALQATPSVGKPGDQIKVSAFVTDTSGNRSTSAAVLLVPVTADAPPSVSITTPSGGMSFKTGDRVTVTVSAADDVGVNQVGYRAATGNPQDAASIALTPASTAAIKTFAFTVPSDAVPGSSIVISATATDTKGQATPASSVAITVLDATPPAVTITGTTTGARVSPGQQTSAIVLAQDLGGVATITLTTGGAVVGTQSQAVSPTQNSVAASFSFTVPNTAHPGDTLTLDATATDAAGNVGTAARILLPVADLNPPTLTLRTSTGSLDLVPGATATAIVQATDDTAVVSATLQAQGAFSFSTSQQVTPPSNSAQLSFDIQVPASAAEGATLNLAARATDVFGNVSAPATLALTVRSSQTVTLPPSAIVAAGDTVPVSVQLGTPAGPGGVRVDLKTDNTSIAGVDPFVQFNEGESAKSATVTGVSGGLSTLTASINGVQRASMTVTVRGGIVSGTVVNDQLQPVAGVQVAVSYGFGVQNAVTDSAGNFSVEDVGLGFTTAFTVKAFDPATKFIGFAGGSLNVAGGFARVTVVLVSAGSIDGAVVRADGATAVGAGARVDLFSSSNPGTSLGTVFTDDSGHYEFPVVSLGSYYVEASDISGNRGRSAAATLSTSGQTVTLGVTYLGRGTVKGVVHDSSGNGVPNVPVSLNVTSLFGNAPTVQINAQPDGTFEFDNVFVGSFTVQARDQVSNLAGTVSGSIQQDGQTTTVEIVLAPWATLTGVVYRPDGVTPVPNAQVTVVLTGVSLTTTTDANGQYTIPFVPLGSYALQAIDASTNGVARVSGTLAVNGQTVTQDLVFLPQGTLVVTVVNGTGAPVAGASVSVFQPNGSGVFLMGTTDASGMVVIQHVLAGNAIQITAIAGSLTGTLTTSLQPDEVKPITLALAPTASIAGTVFLPDGQSPASAVTVEACGYGCTSSIPVNPDGTYRFDGLRLATWTVTVTDASNQKRALQNNIALTAAGQVDVVNLTMAGVGTVTGRVLNPDSSSASNMSVTVRSLDPVLGGFAQTQTDAAGFYQVNDVIVGGVTATAGDINRGLLGESQGTLVHDGDTLGLDVLLKNNAVTLPITKSDANFFTFDLQQDGSIANGYHSVFGFDCCPITQGAEYLDLIANGTPNRFTGKSIGTTEDFGRQVVLSQNGLAGLNVTRKVLVSNAYFARYLELLTNPTTAPVTVDVRVSGKVKAVGVAATSSGDGLLDVSDPATADRWVLFDEPQYDPNLTGALPQVGFAFDGPGAASRAMLASFSAIPGTSSGQYDIGWSSVTIQPGQTVGLMHFTVQQYSRAAEQASLNRLVQLPPEALEGLSPTEIAAIQNFAVPPDGTSALTPLPPLGGVVTGHLFEADGITPVVQANVRFRSQNIFFGRAYQRSASLTGTFSFGDANMTVPIDAFTVVADHPVTRVTSTPASGAFLSGVTTASVNVIFSNTGIVRGSVRRTSGQLVSGAAITAYDQQSNLGATYAPSGNDGSYQAVGLPPDTVTLTASLPLTQGTFGGVLAGSTTVSVVAGQIQAADIIMEPTGALTGTVHTALGAVAPNVLVQINGCRSAGCFAMQTRTDSSGVYRFTDVPVASVTVTAFDPNTNFPATGTVSIVQDQTSTVNLTFVGTGSIAVVAKLANGVAAASAYVEVARPSGASAVFTDANGRATITGVLPGQFVLHVHHPANFSITADVTGTITFTGQTVTVSPVLPPAGTIVVQVTSGGVPVAFGQVQTDVTTPGLLQTAGYTDSTGRFQQTGVPGGIAIHVVASDSQGVMSAGATATVTTEGQVVTVPIAVDAVGTVTGRVTAANGAPVGGLSVSMQAAAGATPLSSQTIQDGSYVFQGVPTGTFRVAVSDSIGSGFATGELVHGGDVVTADIQLTAKRLTATLRDANGFQYGVASGGTVGGGAYSSFASLSVGAAGSFGSYFSGSSYAATELNGNQLVIPNAPTGPLTLPIDGLAVTRKIYVDPSGYFARALDIFDNPGPSPVLLDVALQGGLTASSVLATSSGGATLSTADQWFVTDSGGVPASNAAIVFAGANAPLQISTVQASSLSFMTLGWNSVVVPAGGRTILMRFQAQAGDQATAVAMAQRLAQLPPEALAGMTTSELSAVQNFVLPLDGSSAVAPFGVISGHVFASDGVTPAANVGVRVTGNAAPYFAPTVTVTTDNTGAYIARTLAAGPVTVQASDPATGALTAVSSAQSDGVTPLSRDLMFTTGGVLTGAVLSQKGLPVPGVQVYASSDVVFLSTFTGADGVYHFALLPTGSYTLQARPSDGRATVLTGVAVTSGAVTTTNITLPALASVRVTLTQAGTPFVGAIVTLGRFRGPTNTAGQVLVPNIAEGPFSVQIQVPNSSGSLQLSGAVQPADDGGIVDVAAQVLLGTVTGTVYAGDGATPIPSTSVQVSDATSGAQLAYAQTDAVGHYQVQNLLVTGPFQVVAQSPVSGVTAQALGSFATSTTAVVDLTVPVGVVTGVVTQSDNVTTVPFASLEFAQEASDGTASTQGAVSDGDGRFTFFGLVGDFQVQAKDDLNWYAALASGTLSDVTKPVSTSLALPPLGQVTGVVLDSNGQPVPYANVYVNSGRTDPYFYQSISTDFSGTYTFQRVPVGGVSVQACAFTTANVCAASGGRIAAAGAQIEVDVRLPATGTVTGVLVAADGFTPLASASVVLSPLNDGPNRFEQQVGSSDGTGHYTFSNVPAGPVTVTLVDTSFSGIGIASGSVPAGGSVSLNVTAGTAGPCKNTLFDAASFEFDVQCNATLTGGGTADQRFQSAYDTAYTLKVNGQSPFSAWAASSELGGRQLVYGPSGLSGLTATRKVFVPASGHFARYLDTITNPTSSPMTVEVQIDSTLDGVVRLAVDPATTGTYAITVADPSQYFSYQYYRYLTLTHPALGHVFGNLAASVLVDGAKFQQFIGNSYYRWTVTINPGQSMTFMHFAFMHDPTDIPGANTQAQALVGLTDPDALDGMSPADKASVVNFAIQP